MVRSFPFKENLLLIVSAHCHHVADSFQSWFTGSDWDVVIATHQWANLLKRSEVNCFIGTKGILHRQGRYIFVRLNRIFCEPSLTDAPRLGLTWWEVKHLSQQLHIFIFFGGWTTSRALYLMLFGNRQTWDPSNLSDLSAASITVGSLFLKHWGEQLNLKLCFSQRRNRRSSGSDPTFISLPNTGLLVLKCEHSLLSCEEAHSTETKTLIFLLPVAEALQ